MQFGNNLTNCKFSVFQVLLIESASHIVYFCEHMKQIKMGAAIKACDFILLSPGKFFCPFPSLWLHNSLDS